MADALLKIEGIHKRFGGLHALNDVGLTINRGEIYGLIGPNGAGKTTLFNVLTGLYQPDEGKFTFNGQDLFRQKPHVVVKAGIARTFQNIRLFGEMTALENVMVGRHVRTKAGVFGAILRTAAQRAEEAAIKRRAEELLRYVGIAHRAGDLARHLSYGDQRRLEIARALATHPKLLLLDEPAAGMNPNETGELMDTIRLVRKEYQVTILLIEHDMKLVQGICEYLYVLNFGRLLAEGTPDKVLNDPAVVKAYLGD